MNQENTNTLSASEGYNHPPLLQTPSQTVGPYFAYGLTPQQYGYDFRQLATNQLTDPHSTEGLITIIGKVFDGEGQTINDALVEIWQNDGQNSLFGRCGTGTDPQHRFVFHTVKPQPVNGQAPYLTLILFMRGQLIHSYTRIYFDDEALLNASDEVLNSLPEERRHTVIATRKGNYYEFNINMQGTDETIFFDF